MLTLQAQGQAEKFRNMRSNFGNTSFDLIKWQLGKITDSFIYHHSLHRLKLIYFLCYNL